MKKPNAYLVYLIAQGTEGVAALLIGTVNMVYLATLVGLNPFQMVLVGTTLEVSYFLFEIPTGIVADVRSRRLSVIIGFLLMGFGFILEGAIPLFVTVLLAQVVWGIGATFISGAYDAWIADEIKHHTNDETDVSLGQVYLRGTQFHQVGALLGIGLSVALASLTITLPIILGGALFVMLALFLALVMPEDGFTPTSSAERNTWQSLRQTLTDGLRLVRGRPILITILVISAIFGTFSEGYDRLWTPHLLDNFTFPVLGQWQPVIWFGIIRAVSMVLAIGATEMARRRLEVDNQPLLIRTLVGFNTLLIISIVIFGLATNFFLALIAIWVANITRTTIQPLYTAWINRHVESKVRATLLSINGQADSFGQIVGGPVIGAIGTIFSLRVALTTAGLILSPALALYARTLKAGEVPEVVYSD